MDNYNLYSEFNIDKHKQTYVNYLEVIIKPSGKIEYAIPSHQEKLISIYTKEHNCYRSEMNDLVPREYWCDFLTWLINETRCSVVYTNYIIHPNNPTRFQKKAEQQLIKAGLLNIEKEDCLTNCLTKKG